MSVTTKTVQSVDTGVATYSYSGITLLDTTFAPLNQQIKVYYRDADVGELTELTESVDFTFATLPTQEITLIGSALANRSNDDLLVIERDTKQDALYTTFTGLSNLRADSVNNNSNQLLHIIQENTTAVDNALQKSTDLTEWEGEGLPSTNCSAAVTSSGWTTLAQVNALISGAEIATTQDAFFEQWTSDGSSTYALTGFPASDVDPKKLHVYFDGVRQIPDDGATTNDYDYTLVGSDPTVSFTVNPPVGTEVMFHTLRGTVQTTLDPGSIDGDAIVDGTLSINSIEVSSGSNNRFVTWNSSGTPTIGTIVHTAISDFDAGVQANTLDSLAAATGTVSAGTSGNEQNIEYVATPSASHHAATKGYVDGQISGISEVAGSNSFMLPATGKGYTVTGTAGSETPSAYPLVQTGLDNGTYAVWIQARASFSGHYVTANGVERSIGNEATQGTAMAVLLCEVTSNTMTIEHSGGNNFISHVMAFRID